MAERAADPPARLLARHLGSLLGAYRLYPDDPSHPSVAAAIDRAVVTAREAVPVGPVGVEVRHGEPFVGGEPVVGDDHIQRLATACYERQVEYLEVRAVPDREALVALCAALSAPPEDDHDPQELLTACGVASIELHPVPPVSAHEPDDPAETLTHDQRELWAQLRDPRRLAANLLVAGVAQDPGTAAEELYRFLRTAYGVLPPALLARYGFFHHVLDVLGHLPGQVRRELLARLITRMSGDPFANACGVELTDPQLAEVLRTVAGTEGPDLRALAQQVLDATGRPDGVLDLLTDRPGHDGQADETAGEGMIALRELLADPGGEGLLEAVAGDAAAVREQWPEDDRLQVAALAAFRDYLSCAPDPEQLDGVLARWQEEVRGALVGGDSVRALALHDVVTAATDREVEGMRRAVMAERLEGLLTPDTVGRLLADPARSTDAVAVLLAPFGPAALDAVLELLAVSQDRGQRGRLVAVAGELARDHLERVGVRLDDPRWYLVRNVATVLARVGRPALPEVVRLLAHPEPRVRREAVRSLVAVAGADAVPHLERAAADRHDGVAAAAVDALAGLRVSAAAQALASLTARGPAEPLRRRALQRLADHPDVTAGALLADLASRRHQPRLPRNLRRAARRAARRRGAG